MKIGRYTFCAAFLVSFAPAVMEAAGAQANFSAGFDVDIFAPGATFTVIESRTFGDVVVIEGVGKGLTTATPDPFDINPQSFAYSGEAHVEVPRFGFLDASRESEVRVRAVNETDTDITGTVDWSLLMEVSAEKAPGGSVQDPFAFGRIDFSVRADGTILTLAGTFFEVPEGTRGAASSFARDAVTPFVLEPGEALSVSTAFNGFAFVQVVPVPPTMALALTALLGLGCVTARRV